MQQYSGIADLETYTARMGMGMMDKLFFVDKINPGVVLDFGCADGLLIEHMAPWLPHAQFIGFDVDEEMIAAARTRFEGQQETRFNFCTSWEEVRDQVRLAHERNKKIAGVLSSIIHEIYHYQEPHEVDQFWERIFNTGFDFIVIRDMMPSRSIDRPSDVNDVARTYHRFLNTQQLHDFENAWGSIENNRNLVHFLLKYKYETPNWDREVKENYLPLFREDLLAMIPSQYRVTYHEHYVLPYIRRTVRADFHIELKDPTHLKIILEREDSLDSNVSLEPVFPKDS